jgi:N-acetylglutamate synthase/N-acetylornithine aminotransferase
MAKDHPDDLLDASEPVNIVNIDQDTNSNDSVMSENRSTPNSSPITLQQQRPKKLSANLRGGCQKKWTQLEKEEIWLSHHYVKDPL